jgi:hypothetical protein
MSSVACCCLSSVLWVSLSRVSSRFSTLSSRAASLSSSTVPTEHQRVSTLPVQGVQQGHFQELQKTLAVSTRLRKEQFCRFKKYKKDNKCTVLLIQCILHKNV